MKPKDVNDWAGSPTEIIGLKLGYSIEGRVNTQRQLEKRGV